MVILTKKLKVEGMNSAQHVLTDVVNNSEIQTSGASVDEIFQACLSAVEAHHRDFPHLDHYEQIIKVISIDCLIDSCQCLDKGLFLSLMRFSFILRPSSIDIS